MHAQGGLAIALFTFLYVDLLDTTATLFAMARYAKMLDPVTGDFEGSTKVRRDAQLSNINLFHC